MNNRIKITPKLKYKLKVENSIYYPAIAEAKKGYVELMFYFPDDRGSFIELKSRCLNLENLLHVSKNISEDNPIKLFIRDDLLRPLRYSEPFNFSEAKIKDANDIKDFTKYFDIFEH